MFRSFAHTTAARILVLAGLMLSFAAGERVPLKLTFEEADKKRGAVELTVEVRTITRERNHAHH